MIYLKFLLIFVPLYCIGADDTERKDFYTYCENAIHSQCTHRHDFNEQELENARIYIQNRFYNITNPLWAPVKPPCPKLYVQKDFKCLTHEERLELLDVLSVLYKNGVSNRLSLWPHGAYWGQFHKMAEAGVTHRWLMNVFQKEMQKVKPGITLPYWNPNEEYNQQELSIVWHYLGHAGDAGSNYCVKDGPFANVRPCVKRHWVNDSSIPDENPNELFDSFLQNLDTQAPFAQWVLGPHNKVHLAIGGTEGHMSGPNGPYDNVFQLYHIWQEIILFKWQLQDDKYLMPVNYGSKMTYDREIDGIRPGNLVTDTLLGFDVLVKEAFQYGFGDLCSIPDVIIDDIQYVIAGQQKPMPKKYRQMAVPVLKKYFPNFYSGNFTPFHWQSNDVPDCNRQCLPIPLSPDFVDTLEGNVFLERMKYWNRFNSKGLILNFETFDNQFVDDLNSYGYCSPYIIS